MRTYSLQALCTFVGFGACRVVDGSGQHDHLILLQQHAEELSKTGHARSTPLGLGVPISEKGYQTVAALNNDDEMKVFIRRVAETEARRIADEAQLSGLTPYYSGTNAVASLDALKKELRSAPWVADGEGRAAPLSEDGYQRVAKLKSKPHMVAYSRRILDASKKKCSDEGALHGLVPYFDGEISVQSFSQLQKELLSASWAVSREFDVAPKPLAPASLVRESPEDPTETAFRDFDVDNDHLISREELKNGLARFDRDFTDAEVDQMFSEADLDADGSIDIEEFKQKLQD